MDPYRVLGISRSADMDTIKKAYKKLAKQLHPDRNPDPAAAERFKQVNDAFAILKDPEKKRQFDRWGRVGSSPFSGRPGSSRTTGSHGFDVEDMLSSMFGFQAGRQPRRSTGRDVKTSVVIPPLIAFTGGEIRVQLPRVTDGKSSIQLKIPAGVTDGQVLRVRGMGGPAPGGGPAGNLNVTLNIGDHALLKRDNKDLIMDVPLTVGEAIRGTMIDIPTPTGKVSVKVPPGVQSGMKLRIKGRGVQTKDAGDLYLVLRPTPPDEVTHEMQSAIDELEKGYTKNPRTKLSL